VQFQKAQTMNFKLVLPLLIGFAVLAGCAQTDRYPLTGSTIGANDQVRFMTAPGMLQN
jgi:hypothetical protein